MSASRQASAESHEKFLRYRYDFSFNCTFEIRHAKRINILVILKYKSNNELSKKKVVYFDDIIISAFSTRTDSLYA